MKLKHENLIGLAPVLPTDYSEHGGKIERWKEPNESYPDCSHGCRWFAKLSGGLGNDWGVCAKRDAPRAGLLTFEHQAGRGCFEP